MILRALAVWIRPRNLMLVVGMFLGTKTGETKASETINHVLQYFKCCLTLQHRYTSNNQENKFKINMLNI